MNKIIFNISFLLLSLSIFPTINKSKKILTDKDLEELFFNSFNNQNFQKEAETTNSIDLKKEIENEKNNSQKEKDQSVQKIDQKSSTTKNEKSKKNLDKKSSFIAPQTNSSNKKTGTEVTLYTNSEIKNPEDIAKLLAESGKALEEFFKSDSWTGNINSKGPFLNVSQTKEERDPCKDIYYA
jgi:hypothetical protein